VLRNRECMAQHPASQAACFVDNRVIVLALECRDEHHHLAFNTDRVSLGQACAAVGLKSQQALCGHLQ